MDNYQITWLFHRPAYSVSLPTGSQTVTPARNSEVADSALTVNSESIPNFITRSLRRTLVSRSTLIFSPRSPQGLFLLRFRLRISSSCKNPGSKSHRPNPYHSLETTVHLLNTRRRRNLLSPPPYSYMITGKHAMEMFVRCTANGKPKQRRVTRRYADRW